MPKVVNQHSARLTLHDAKGGAFSLAPGESGDVEADLDEHIFVAAGWIKVIEPGTKPTEDDAEQPEQKDIRDEYQELFGKKAGNKKPETIQSEIDAEKQRLASAE